LKEYSFIDPEYFQNYAFSAAANDLNYAADHAYSQAFYERFEGCANGPEKSVTHNLLLGEGVHGVHVGSSRKISIPAKAREMAARPEINLMLIVFLYS